MLDALRHDLTVVLGQTDLIHELRNAGLMLDVQLGESFAEEIRANASAWRAIIETCGLRAT
jgi:tripartite-type tricarboxylate transporter receptor subunit TctC